jgi:hypothetical protein
MSGTTERNTSKSVTVDRQVLIHMLMDHASMLAALGWLGRAEIREPKR